MAGIYETVPASPEDVEAFAETLTDAYLHCRVFGHDPEPHNLTFATEEERAAHRRYVTALWSGQMRCSHGCGVRWRILADGEGEMLMRKLDYSDAPDYLLRGKGRIGAQGNQVLRKAFFVRKVGVPSSTRRTVRKPPTKSTKKKG